MQVPAVRQVRVVLMSSVLLALQHSTVAIWIGIALPKALTAAFPRTILLRAWYVAGRKTAAFRTIFALRLEYAAMAPNKILAKFAKTIHNVAVSVLRIQALPGVFLAYAAQRKQWVKRAPKTRIVAPKLASTVHAAIVLQLTVNVLIPRNVAPTTVITEFWMK
jgi:hypothetical protein